MFGVPVCPGVMFKSRFLQFSPSVAEVRKVKLLILCLHPSHFNWCHFLSPSSPQTSEKEGKGSQTLWASREQRI